MLSVNMIMLSTLLILLGSSISPSNGNFKLQLKNEMSQSAGTGGKSPCGCKDHHHKPPCDHHEDPHEHDCCKPFGCHDPCVLDPPEVCTDPLQGIPSDDPSLTILVHLIWPRRDVFWYLDAFSATLPGSTVRRKRQAVGNQSPSTTRRLPATNVPTTRGPLTTNVPTTTKPPTTTVLTTRGPPTTNMPTTTDGTTTSTTPTTTDGTTTSTTSTAPTTTNGTTTSTAPTTTEPPTNTTERPPTPTTESPFPPDTDFDEFVNETQLGVIAEILEKNTTKEQSDALIAGEAELAAEDTMKLAIRAANITFDQSAPTIQHQLAFRRTDPISTRMARVGVITEGATRNFIRALNVPIAATAGLSLIGPFSNCEATNSDNLRPDLIEPHSSESSRRIRRSSHDCPNPDDPYRTLDGSCNNLEHVFFGAAFTAYRRNLVADYDDEVSSFRKAVSGLDLPGARFVSTTINTKLSKESLSFSILHMTFGQFVDHDLLATPMARASFAGYSTDTSPVKCCDIFARFFLPECAPIDIPVDDPFYGCYDQTCMEFVRSAPSGNCLCGPRDQINQQTAYLDASVVYGVQPTQTDELRTFVNGLLTGQVTAANQMLLPKDPESHDADGCNRADRMAQGEFCFKAGDGRVNEQILLTFFQTLWAREHNRVARILHKFNCGWDDEKLFQEARRIIGAELQQVVYYEYLSTIIGPTQMALTDLNTLKGSQQTTDYDSTFHTGIANSFATAAYRFGHSLIADDLLFITKYGKVKPRELSTLLFNPFELYRKDAMCDLARGGLGKPEDAMDPHITEQVAGKLFRGEKPFGLDLLALNIQRGRDHGLQPYNKWRKFCGLPEAETFQDLSPQITPERIMALEDAYEDVNDIDLYVGGISEDPIPGAVVGHTFACIIHDQFLRLKRGDRYWFEYKNGPGAFTKAQINQLHRVTLARIMCNNIPELEYVQRWPLRNLGPDNPKVCCKSIREYNLDPWNCHYKEKYDHEYKNEDECY